jgi:Ca2+/Na+ antiporter
MTVILDLLGSLDLLQNAIHVFIFYFLFFIFYFLFFYRTLWCLTTFLFYFFIFYFVRTNQKNVDTVEIFLVNLIPANSENQQPSNATIQQIIHWPIPHFL